MNIECAFLGVLGRDAERRTPKPGRPYLLLNVRVGEGDGVQWVSVLTFDPQAIDAADKLMKGALACTARERSASTNGKLRMALCGRAFRLCPSNTRLAQIGRQKVKSADDKILRAAAERLNEIADMRDGAGRRA